MEAPVTRCLKCGKPRTKRWKLKDFCSYSCRGQHAVDTLDGTKYRTGLSGSRNLKKNKALQSLKRGAIAGISFAKINSITYRIDRPSKKGIGWLMEVAWPASGSRQRWVARDGDAASEPLPLEEAKRAAEELLNNRRKTKPRDHIRELNQIAANEVGRVDRAREAHVARRSNGRSAAPQEAATHGHRPQTPSGHLGHRAHPGRRRTGYPRSPPRGRLSHRDGWRWLPDHAGMSTADRRDRSSTHDTVRC
jgi:hypothetical protein